MRESFVFYRSFFEALLGMSPENQGDCLMAVANYALNGEEPKTLTPEVRMFFTLVKPQIDANNQKLENGRKGGRPKNQTETETKPNNNQTITKPKPNDNQNITEDKPVVLQKEEKKNPPLTPCKENNKNIIPPDNNKLLSSPKGDSLPSKRFIKPTVEEISSYCQERNNTISAEQFFNFYESKGWRVGNQPMKDWKAAVRTWEAKEKTPNVAKDLVKNDNDFWRQLGC